jgi:hypothetical protein
MNHAVRHASIILIAALPFAAAGAGVARADMPARLGTPAVRPTASPAVTRAGRLGAGSGPSALSAAQVQARLSASRAALAAYHVAAPQNALPAALRETDASSVLRAMQVGGSFSASAAVAQRAVSGLEYVELRDTGSGARVDTSKPILAGHEYMLIARSSNPALPEAQHIPYTMSVPACNVSVTMPNGRLMNPRLRMNTERSQANTYVLSFVPGGLGRVPIGTKPHPMTLRYPAAGSVLTASFTVQNEEKYHQALKAVVDENGVLAADDGSGITAANLQSRVQVRRVNTTDTPMFGMDFVGRGIALAPGVTAAARILRASSVADPPEDWSPDNVYRGATITAQPGSAQLETRVEWHIGPHESLQYILGWDLLAQPGQRPILSMPLSGPCDA